MYYVYVLKSLKISQRISLAQNEKFTSSFTCASIRYAIIEVAVRNFWRHTAKKDLKELLLCAITLRQRSQL